MKSSSMQRTVNSSFGFIIFILGLLAGSLFLTTHRLDSNFHRLTLNYQIADHLYQLKNQAKVCQQTLKDYLKSPQSIQLKIYKTNTINIQKKLTHLADLVQEDSTDLKLFRKANQLIQNELFFLEHVLLSYKKQILSSSNLKAVYKNQEKLINQQEFLFEKDLQSIILGFHKAEIAQSKKTEQLTQKLTFFIFCSSAGILIALLIAYLCILREVISHQKTQLELNKTHQKVLEISQIKSNFLAMMGHEIKNPLNGIQGIAEDLLQSTLNKEQKGHLQLILHASTNILTVLDDILYFSRAEAKKITLVESSFSLRELLHKLMQFYGQSADKKKINLTYYVSSQIPDFLITDHHCLRRILSNLIENAIKYTETGDVFIEVEPVRQNKKSAETPLKAIRFNILDTGLGMSAEQQALIFQPYTQVHNNGPKKHPGSGLGLSICQSLVEMMDGSIDVRSTPGIGSTFSLTIPIRISEPANEEWQHFKNKMLHMERISILVLTGNKSTAQTLKRTLSDWQFTPVFSNDTEQSLNILTAASQKKKPFHMLIIDDETSNGIILIEQIRNTHALCDIRILLIGNQHPTFDSGISAYLTKPVCPTHLLNALWQLNHNYSQLQKYIPKPEKETGFSTIAHEILLAEDNEINQAFVSQALKNKGYQVTIASTGPEVLQWMAQKKFDLILMDLELPEMDGFTVTKKIREEELKQGGLNPEQHIPILALTAHSDEHILSRALLAGIDDYLLKPFKVSSLQKKLSEHLPAHLSESLNPNDFSNTEKILLPHSNIDQVTIMGQTDEKIEQLKHLVGLFEQSTAKQLSGIYEAIEQESMDALQRNIHALKGGISTFTTGKAYQIAKSLEDSTLSPHKKEYATLKRKADELQIAVNTLRQDLYTMIETR